MDNTLTNQTGTRASAAAGSPANILRVSPTIGTRQLVDELTSRRDCGAEWQLVALDGYDIELSELSRRRLFQLAEDTGALLLYCDYRTPDGPHPLAPYQPGSVRDDFDFGPLMVVSMHLFGTETAPVESLHSGLYALRLWFAQHSPAAIVHVPEYLYTASVADRRTSGEQQFDYVDPRNAAVQREREEVFTDYLRRIGAWLDERTFTLSFDEGEFPVEASVIIPVRNRVATVADAVKSALSQTAPFSFNVIVVDNHSTDGTTETLAALAASDSRVVHLIPEETTLGIGGCWEYGVRNAACGRFAVQLDSDDQYKDSNVLSRIVDCFRATGAGMVIGSYELTDFDGNPLPPGLIDHKEWTDDNGHNNALRINGLGAPRAFFTPLLRQIGVPNVSYGEDYALGLRISRRHRIGRIFDSLYLCRRWSGNSDAALPQERVNANNIYKDLLRSIEIEARKRLAAKEYFQTSRKESRRITEFVDNQLRAWPLARTNTEALANVETRHIEADEFDFRAIFNPARAVSSGAKVDAASIAARRCFLCADNRPDSQEVYPVMEGYEGLVNPYPVFPRHLTIAAVAHTPQSLSDSPGDLRRVADMMELSGRLPGMVVFYNGAKCGASAPDHMHFQAVRSADLPIFESAAARAFPYRHIFFSVATREQLMSRMHEIVNVLAMLPENKGEAEPRMNLYMMRRDDRTVDVLVIPRRAHRPACYGTDPGQMLISPGAIDVAGCFICARECDFRALDSDSLLKILSDTCYRLRDRD